MPSLTIGPVPVRISQSVTDQATLQNTGNETIYLDTNSAVSPVAYGIEISPRASLNWSANQELWAVTAVDDSTLSVLYGGEGVTVSEVGAVVTGDVTATVTGPVDVTGTVDANITNATIDATITGNVVIDSGVVNVGGILTPVTVQGGGVILYNDEIANVPANSFTEIDIDGPADGTTFYGIDISWEILTSTESVTASTIRVFVNGFPGTPLRATALRDTSAAELNYIGLPETVSFTTPMRTSFPLKIRVYNSQAANTLTGFLRVTGTSYASPYPVDNGETWNADGETLLAAITAPAALTYITLPASFSTCVYLMQASTAGLDEVYLRQWNDATDAFDILLARASRSKYYTQAAAGIAYQIQEIVTPPVGRPHRVWFQIAHAGSVRISLSEVIR